MNRYLTLYGVRIGPAEIRWYPAYLNRILDVAINLWIARPIPANYHARVLVHFDWWVGCRVIKWQVEGAMLYWQPFLERSIYVEHPELAEAIMSALPERWQQEWRYPVDPTIDPPEER